MPRTVIKGSKPEKLSFNYLHKKSSSQLIVVRKGWDAGRPGSFMMGSRES
jgi:hypothetical protein